MQLILNREFIINCVVNQFWWWQKAELNYSFLDFVKSTPIPSQLKATPFRVSISSKLRRYQSWNAFCLNFGTIHYM